MKTFIGKEFEDKYLPVEIEKINNILGTNLKYEDYVIYLSKLGFEIKDMIKVPSFRHDISTQNDLAEEIARIIGFDKIKSIPLNLNSNLSPNQNKIADIEDFFVENGFSEVINFPSPQMKRKSQF